MVKPDTSITDVKHRSSYDDVRQESGEMLTIGARAPHSIAIGPEFPEGNHRMRRVPCMRKNRA